MGLPAKRSQRIGPGDGTILVRTRRAGAAAKAGHDLVIEVGSWEATMQSNEDTIVGVCLVAHTSSLRVREGTGGVRALGDDDKASIEKTIESDVLVGKDIEFSSTDVQAASDGCFTVTGSLKLIGNTRPISFEMRRDDERTLRAAALVKQSDWGMEPYSTLFGTLKVADVVEVLFEGGPDLLC